MTGPEGASCPAAARFLPPRGACWERPRRKRKALAERSRAAPRSFSRSRGRGRPQRSPRAGTARGTRRRSGAGPGRAEPAAHGAVREQGSGGRCGQLRLNRTHPREMSGNEKEFPLLGVNFPFLRAVKRLSGRFPSAGPSCSWDGLYCRNGESALGAGQARSSRAGCAPSEVPFRELPEQRGSKGLQ